MEFASSLQNNASRIIHYRNVYKGNSSPVRHLALEFLGCLGVGGVHFFVAILQLGPVLHYLQREIPEHVITPRATLLDDGVTLVTRSR